MEVTALPRGGGRIKLRRSIAKSSAVSCRSVSHSRSARGRSIGAAVWMFFDSDTYEAWLDVVITGLFVIAIAIPALCWLTWRRNADGARDEGHPSFRDWAVGEFKTWTGPVKGANATAEVLLPIAAVAVGMTVLGLVFHIIASGGA